MKEDRVGDGEREAPEVRKRAGECAGRRGEGRVSGDAAPRSDVFVALLTVSLCWTASVLAARSPLHLQNFIILHVIWRTAAPSSSTTSHSSARVVSAENWTFWPNNLVTLLQDNDQF